LALNKLMQYFYKLESEEASPEKEKMMEYWGGMLLEIRRDLGKRKAKLRKKYIHRGHITDTDQVIGD